MELQREAEPLRRGGDLGDAGDEGARCGVGPVEEGVFPFCRENGLRHVGAQ